MGLLDALKEIEKVLNSIEIRGEKNLNRMLGAMLLLRKAIDVLASGGEKADDHNCAGDQR